MPYEKERKFLVLSDSWKSCSSASLPIRQGYLNADPCRTVRVRIAGEKAFLCVKGKTVGDTRREYEYEIPACDAREMLSGLCRPPLIEKRRFFCRVDGFDWEVDVFAGSNEGLVLAELECTAGGRWPESLPRWIGPEVTGDVRYYNSNLQNNPYENWRGRL